MEQSQPIKQVCGVCKDEWLTEAEYVAHTCTTGFTPAQPEHLINSTTPDFTAISDAAIARGAEDTAQAQEVSEQAPVQEVQPEVTPQPPAEPVAPTINLS